MQGKDIGKCLFGIILSGCLTQVAALNRWLLKQVHLQLQSRFLCPHNFCFGDIIKLDRPFVSLSVLPLFCSSMPTVSGAYLLYYFRQEYHLAQIFNITWHKYSSRNGDVSHARLRSVAQRSRSQSHVKVEKMCVLTIEK